MVYGLLLRIFIIKLRYLNRLVEINSNEETMVTQFLNLENERPRIQLNLLVYFTMILSIAVVILSIGCLSYQTDVINYIKSIAIDQEIWKNIFGTNTWQSVVSSCSNYMYAIGSLGIVLFITLHYLLYFIFKILGKYEFWQLTIKFISVLIYIIGFVLLYAAVYADKYKEVAQVDKAMPTWVVTGLFGISISCIIIGIAGFITAYTENRKYLHYFGFYMGLVSILILVFSILGAIYCNQFKSFFQNNCFTIIDYINKDYLKNYTICDKKYDFNSTSLRNISNTCPKARVAIIWEINVGLDLVNQKDLYGCLDYGCCLTLYARWWCSNE